MKRKWQYGLKPGEDRTQIMPTDKEIRDIKLRRKAKDLKQLKLFHGMTSYFNRHNQRIAKITPSLRDLTMDNVPFLSGPQYSDVFHTT